MRSGCGGSPTPVPHRIRNPVRNPGAFCSGDGVRGPDFDPSPLQNAPGFRTGFRIRCGTGVGEPPRPLRTRDRPLPGQPAVVVVVVVDDVVVVVVVVRDDDGRRRSPTFPDPASAPDSESEPEADFRLPISNFGLEGKSVRGAALEGKSVRGGSRARCVALSGRPRRCKFRATRQICS